MHVLGFPRTQTQTETLSSLATDFSSSQLDAERGRSACSRQHSGHLACYFAITWTTGECFAVIFAMRGPSISHIWSPFRGCGASERFSACGADFMNPKNHMHTQRDFGMAICMKEQWRGLWLELFFGFHFTVDIACDAALEGRSPCTQKNRTHPIRGFRHILLGTMSLSRTVGGPHALGT